ncbi:MAG: hypothetical protein HQL76_00735 [Magnetococcales bacterium]|nr:hypothetical protein [Magnetococcales bacterium]
MTTIAEKTAQAFGHHYRTFHSAEAGNLVDVCAGQAVRTVTEFGKKKFVFPDDSAITMGDGQWFIGYGDCFCNAQEGHHPECPGFRVPPASPLPNDDDRSAGAEATSVPSLPVFTIHILGKEPRRVPLDASQHKARVEARAMLTREKQATHACILDVEGAITDAYERVVTGTGEVKIKKVDPRKLPAPVRSSLNG